MKKIFLDTNFIIDLILRDEYKPSCKKVLEIGYKHEMWFYISFLSVANYAYIARKRAQDELYEDLSLIQSYYRNIHRIRSKQRPA